MREVKYPFCYPAMERAEQKCTGAATTKRAPTILTPVLIDVEVEVFPDEAHNAPSRLFRSSIWGITSVEAAGFSWQSGQCCRELNTTWSYREYIRDAGQLEPKNALLLL